MNQNERVEIFLRELSKLTAKYGLSITAEGTTPYLYDEVENGYASYFIYSLDGRYKKVE
jgi:hypothetical protein